MNAEKIPSEIYDWVSQFREEYGRQPRVLHYGNIANNAYLNAKFLRSAGIEADVYCGEYYHVMASAEWEDVDITENYGSDYAPDFSPRVVGAYGRPNWFFQGPLHDAVNYFAILNARREALVPRAIAIPGEPPNEVVNAPPPASDTVAEEQISLSAAKNGYGRVLALADRMGMAKAARHIASFVAPIVSALQYRISQRLTSRPREAQDSDAENSELASARAATLHLIDAFDAVFPDRADRLAHDDLIPYLGSIPLWRQLFEPYDLIQSYATDPIFPLLVGDKKYVAYEHGTLRDFIRKDESYHRLTALSYRLANHVFVTNGDCFAHADWLGCENVTPMIHPVDIDQHRRRDEDAIALLRRTYDAEVILFCPLRHDWKVKGTDVHIRALPEIKRRTGKRIALVLSPWGSQVEQSKALLQELGCNDSIRWLEAPLSRPKMILHIHAADVVLDQIALPHFGATAPQALAAGTPVVMSYEHTSVERIVTRPAPILSAFTPSDVVDCVERAIDPRWRLDFFARAKQWIDEQHHSDRIIRDHLAVYKRLMGL